jgi:hypothetical protein
MTRTQRAKVRADFYESLAVELDCHIANGSGFIFDDGAGDAAKAVVDLRLSILKSVVNEMYRRRDRVLPGSRRAP